MAPLNPVHWETVTPRMRRILGTLGRLPWMARFYLAGGTALALRIGHRRSIDLDFFSATDPIDAARRRNILDSLGPEQPAVVEDVDGNLLFRIDDDLHIAFLSYGYALLDETDPVQGVSVASIRDVGLMKLDAIVSRGSRKDYYDLFFIAQRHSLDRLLEHAGAKYPYARDFPLMAVESLLRLDNADRDRQPEMLVDTEWPDVRAFFVAEAERLGKTWFGEDGRGS